MLLGALLFVGCKDNGRVGDFCLAQEDCNSGLECINRGRQATQTSVCMKPCDAEVVLCSDGSVCTDLDDGESRVCLVGGATEIGSPCDVTTDCVRGAICVSEVGASHCREACDPTVGACVVGTCQALGAMGHGFCNPDAALSDAGIPLGDAGGT